MGQARTRAGWVLLFTPLFCLAACEGGTLVGPGDLGPAGDAGTGETGLHPDLGSSGDGLARETAPPTPDGGGAKPEAGPKPDGAPKPDGPTPQPGKLFRLVMMPDTQYYTQTASYFKHFTAQTQWVVQNRVSQALAFLSHMGDIVNDGANPPNNNKTQWDRADQAMDILDGDLAKQPDGHIPYGTPPGNHDFDTKHVKGAATQYLAYFGPGRFAKRSWFLGSSPNKLSGAQTFSVGGMPYLHFSLEWLPSDATITWAQGLMDKQPKTPVILATHQYMGTGNPASRHTAGETADGTGDNSAESLYRKLVEPNPQVFLVLCGHVGGDGRLLSTTPLGRPVMQVLADYQFDANGGNGWMQLVTLDPVKKTCSFNAFSPTYQAGTTSGTDHSKSSASNHSFSFDLDAHRALLSGLTVRRFRQGQDSGAGAYAGTVDTYVGTGSDGTTLPGTAYGAKGDIRVDGNQDQEQGLLRFDGIVGTGAGQVPPGTKIKKAVLTVTTEGSYADSKEGARFHRMKVAWSEASTYNSLVGGVQVGQECETTHELDTKGQVTTKGTRTFDVTASVQAWLDGKPNHGWVLLNIGGTDMWIFRSSEWTAVAERPMLTVLY